ncbi:hypothetical protein ACFTSF_34645 [Kribbella sp. NPDC056951]|uniref:hypothetical protein n=1 Tax=Kribbella sp. NPDC056951 TaxID=3345978 RepID=UPI0036418828
MGQLLDGWADLLDQSWERIGSVSADARTFDRVVVNRIANLWDNNTSGLFVAACLRGAVRREEEADRCIRWMAEFEPDRYRWAIEHVGRPAGWPLPAVASAAVSARDGAGVVWPAEQQLVSSVVAELAVDYQLETAKVTAVTVERTQARFEATVTLLAERRFATSQEEPAELHVEFTDVEALWFEHNDRSGARFEWPDGKPSVAIGKHGVVRARSATVGIWDPEWYLSAAGRALDAILPVDVAKRPSGWSEENLHRRRWDGRPAAARAAGVLVRDAMIFVRSTWSLSMAAITPIHEFAQAFAGAGSDIVAAGTSLRREAAFRRLIDRWRAAGGDLLAPYFEQGLQGEPHLPQPSGPPDPQCQPLVIRYSTGASMLSGAPQGVTVLLASPGTPWMRRRVHFDEPDEFAVRIEAFDADLAAAQRGRALVLPRMLP